MFPNRPVAPPPPLVPFLPPDPPITAAFWTTLNVRNQLGELRDTLKLARAMKTELETLMVVKDSRLSEGKTEQSFMDLPVSEFSNLLENRKIDLESQESISLEETNSLISKLKAQLEPFRSVVDEKTPWEERSAMIRLGGKINKSRRNKVWRKRKKKHIAETLAKERERYEQADREVDEWRAREVAKDAAKSRVENMKGIAKLKAKEERKKLESELELVMIVEKLQELRSVRMQKMKKQGHFFPEEDDKFLERVRAAVEEEERQAKASADTAAAKDAIAMATAEETQILQNKESITSKPNLDIPENKDHAEKRASSISTSEMSKKKEATEGQNHGGTFDNVANLPIEYYHYYHGSNYDMGTLIEVRRAWDAYIRPGGSRIPGHWVPPSPPADEVWASYLVKPK